MVRSDRKEALDELIRAWLDLQAHNGGAGRRINGAAGPEQETILGQIEAERRELSDHLTEASRRCPEIFYEIQQANYLSQHDLVRDGVDLYIHPWALNLPMSEVSRVYASLRRSFRGRRQKGTPRR